MRLRKYIADAEIVNGVLLLSNRLEMASAIKKMSDGYASVTVSTLDRRSSPANRYYWGVVLEAILRASDDDELTKEDLHAAMCERFLSRRVVTFVSPHGELVEQAYVEGSSTQDSYDFFLFVERVRKFGMEFFEIEIPDPDPNYRAAREKASQEAQHAAA